MQANHTIAVTFTQSAATITATAGTGGSITPPGATSVAVGGNLTYTITPNNGYTIADVVVDGTTHLGAVTTYTFINVTASHTIAATFIANPPTYSLTAPTGTGSYAQGSPVTVSWQATAPVVSGEFGVFAVSTGGVYYGGFVVGANGTANYSFNLPLAVPVGTGYTAAVGFRAIPGSGPWLVWRYSTGAFDVTAPIPPLSVTVTAPTGTGTYTAPAPVTVQWTPNTPVASGEFGIFAVSTGGVYYGGWLVPATGLPNYTFNLPLAVPPGSGYTAAVLYRPTIGTGAWVIFSYSTGTFTVN